jgi:hypothetical protein
VKIKCEISLWNYKEIISLLLSKKSEGKVPSDALVDLIKLLIMNIKFNKFKNNILKYPTFSTCENSN